MKKKVLMFMLNMVLATGLVACGGGSKSAETPDSTGAVVEDAADEEEVVEEEVTGDEIDFSAWDAFVGGFEDGTTLYYVLNEDGSQGGLLVLDPEGTHGASFIGEISLDEETGIESITDDETGLTIGYIVMGQAEDYVEFDFGLLGTAYLQLTDVQEAIDFMNATLAETTDFTQEFCDAIAAAAEEVAEAGEGEAAMDVTGWICYAGGMEDQSTVYYAISPDETVAMFMLMSADETESVFLTGPMEYDDAGNIYITDEASGLVISAAVSETEDGGYMLDFGGDYAVVYDVDSADLINTMMYIESNTTDVTEDFLNAAG